MTQIYQNNSPVFIKVLNKKGIVKDYDSTLDQYYITYFNSKDKRESNWFTMNQLTKFKNGGIAKFKEEDVVTQMSGSVISGDDLEELDKFKNRIDTMLNKWKPYKNVNKNDYINEIRTLSDGRPLYWVDENKKMLTVNPTNYPVLTSNLVYINPEDSIKLVTAKVIENDENLKGEELIKRTEKLLQEWDSLIPFKFKYDEQLEFPVTNNQYDNHIKSLEKLIEGYKLVLSKNNKPLNIKIKYFSDVAPVEKIDKGNWIDLRSAIDIEIKQGERAMIPLGVGMKLPEGYEANVVPRSSTFKTWGIIQTNHYGVIDNSYSGNDDQWHMPVYATRDTKINKNDRICQFRINEIQPEINIEVVENLDEVSRSGFGSTGKN